MCGISGEDKASSLVAIAMKSSWMEGKRCSGMLRSGGLMDSRFIDFMAILTLKLSSDMDILYRVDGKNGMVGYQAPMSYGAPDRFDGTRE